MRKIPYKEARQLLVDVLEKHDAVEKYLDALSSKAVETICNEENYRYLAKCLLDKEFTWSSTKEGHDFWENINDEFEKEYAKREATFKLDVTAGGEPLTREILASDGKLNPAAKISMMEDCEVVRQSFFKYTEGSNYWAFDMMKKGEKVHHEEDLDESYYEYDVHSDNQAHDQDGNQPDLSQFLDNVSGWSIWEDPEENKKKEAPIERIPF